MKQLINFFSNLGKLKGEKRRGWKAHQIEEAESAASHTFRLAFLSWFLAEKKKLNLEQTIKMALLHDLCEVFSFDSTPYDPLLPKDLSTEENKAEAKEILKDWPSLSLEEKKQRGEEKFKEEIKIEDNRANIKKNVDKLYKQIENIKGDQDSVKFRDVVLESSLSGVSRTFLYILYLINEEKIEIKQDSEYGELHIIPR